MPLAVCSRVISSSDNVLPVGLPFNLSLTFLLISSRLSFVEELLAQWLEQKRPEPYVPS